MNLASYFITINPVGLARAAAAAYVEQVHEHLRWIHGTKSGRLLLDCIRRPTFPVEIRPHSDATCNAVGGGERRAGQVGLVGVVTYTPFAFSHAGSCSTSNPLGADRGRIWDEILFHELVHVFRNATGKWSNIAPLTFGMRQYDSNEEFLAVMCANIYVSDRTNKYKSGLRAGHQGFGPMSPADASRFGLFSSSKAAFGLVKKFCADHPIFSKALSDRLADVEYNPVADYYRYPKVCEALSIFGAINDHTQLVAALVQAGIPAATAESFVKASGL